ncbi:MAG: glutathione peroxidase [Armatimonadetes bacterium]|nr:glutathione peroxidase [Armatimonadota bacterium]
MVTLLASLVMLPSIAMKAPETIYDFRMNDIDGHPVSLAKYRGKVLLVVNVASKCGFTPQYAGLESLYTNYRKAGLVVMGFPANEFHAQEPGTNPEIKQFCTMNYGVTFPLFSKIVVKGDGINPLYTWLLANADRHNDIEWNFTKFLIGRDGKVKARFMPNTKPDDPALMAAIQKELATK